MKSLLQSFSKEKNNYDQNYHPSTQKNPTRKPIMNFVFVGGGGGGGGGGRGCCKSRGTCRGWGVRSYLRKKEEERKKEGMINGKT